MDGDETIRWIENWRYKYCDGDWEHQYGIRISTLDNPGWCVHVDLAWTALENEQDIPESEDRSESNWVVYKIEYDSEGAPRFASYGGPKNLTEMLGAFQEWAESHEK